MWKFGEILSTITCGLIILFTCLKLNNYIKLSDFFFFQCDCEVWMAQYSLIHQYLI